MAAMLEQQLFSHGFGTHTYAASVSAAPSNSEASSPLRRPASPPQPVPPRRQQVWEDATQISGSPCSSDATEQFMDCYSEMPSAASSYAEDSGAAMEELAARSAPRLSLNDSLSAAAAAAAAAASTPSSSSSLAGTLQQEQQRRSAAEAVAAELRQQLDDISAQLLAWRGSSCGSLAGLQAPQRQQHVEPEDVNDGKPVAALLRQVLQEVAEQRRQASKQAAAAAEAAAGDAAYVARLVAGLCVRAATAEDLEAQWRQERCLLERRLEQSARMGQAMLKHQKEHSADPEPWRQQLLSAAVSVGCSILGAAAALLIIKRTQGA